MFAVVFLFFWLGICVCLESYGNCGNLWNVSSTTGFYADYYEWSNKSDLDHPVNFSSRGYHRGKYLNSSIVKSPLYNNSDFFITDFQREVPDVPFTAVISTALVVNTSGIYNWYFASSQAILQIGSGSDCCGEFGQEASSQDITKMAANDNGQVAPYRFEAYMTANVIYPLRIIFAASASEGNFFFMRGRFENNFFDVGTFAHPFNYTTSACKLNVEIANGSATQSNDHENSAVRNFFNTHKLGWLIALGVLVL